MILGDLRVGGMCCWLSWWPGWAELLSGHAHLPWPRPIVCLSLPHPRSLKLSCSPVTGLLGEHASVPDGHQTPCWPQR